jgi:hypothetical protein
VALARANVEDNVKPELRIGSQVLFIDNIKSKETPAVVLDVHDAKTGLVTIREFGHMALTSAVYSQVEHRPGTWHFLE